MAKRVERTGVEVAALRPVTRAIRRGGGSVRTARGGDCLAWARLWRSSAAPLSPAQVRLGSHWSRIIEAGLSLVETFIMMKYVHGATIGDKDMDYGDIDMRMDCGPVASCKKLLVTGARKDEVNGQYSKTKKNRRWKKKVGKKSYQIFWTKKKKKIVLKVNTNGKKWKKLNIGKQKVVKYHPNLNTDASAKSPSCEPWQVGWKGKLSVSCGDKQPTGRSGEFSILHRLVHSHWSRIIERPS